MKKLKVILSLIVAIAVCISSTVSISAYEKLTFFIPGDVDCNENVDIVDVTSIQLYLAHLSSVSDNGLLSADFNGDGDVDIMDATEIQLYLANLNNNCFVLPDDNYLKWTDGKCEAIAEEDKILFEEILNDRNVIFTFEDMKGEGSEIALIESVGQFYSLFKVYSPEFNDEFFKENALVVWLAADYDWGNQRKITSIGVKDNTLLLEGETVIANPVSPTPAYWHLFYKVSKSDIINVNKILCNINLTNVELSN